MSPALRHLVLGLALLLAPAAPAELVVGPSENAAAASAELQTPESRRLSSPEKYGVHPANRAANAGKSGAGADSGLLQGVLGPLAVVLVLIGMLAGLVVLIARIRGGSRGSLSASFGAGGRAPAGIMEVLGRYPLAHGLTLVLLKLDRRVLLLSQTRNGRLGGFSLSTICELDSAEDVASILLKVRDAENASLTHKFASVFRSLDREAADKIQNLDGKVMTTIAPAPTPPSRSRGASQISSERQTSFGSDPSPQTDSINSLRSRLEALRVPAARHVRGPRS
ncbi:MAG: hypothetical protein KF691_10885 [Phycisphaeraceae bacterium]|nr:hypothetical protein [Phycisphaeraceae bacterium]